MITALLILQVLTLLLALAIYGRLCRVGQYATDNETDNGTTEQKGSK